MMSDVMSLNDLPSCLGTIGSVWSYIIHYCTIQSCQLHHYRQRQRYGDGDSLRSYQYCLHQILGKGRCQVEHSESIVGKVIVLGHVCRMPLGCLLEVLRTLSATTKTFRTRRSSQASGKPERIFSYIRSL